MNVRFSPVAIFLVKSNRSFLNFRHLTDFFSKIGGFSYHVSNGRYGIRSRMNVRVGMTVAVMHMFMLTYVDVLDPL